MHGAYLRNSASRGHVAVLTVHVVVARTRVIAQPNAEVLHASWLALEHLNQARIKTAETKVKRPN